MKEHEIQKQIVEYFRFKSYVTVCTDVMAALGYLQGNKRFAFIKHYKDIGYTKGQSDIIVIKKNKVIFIEVKSKLGRQSDEQKQFQMLIEKAGIEYLLARSINDVQKV